MKNNNIKAFTIVETLITLLAITLMIAAPLTFMFRSYHYSEFIKEKMIAQGLSQEGLELATSLRNKNLDDFKTIADNCASYSSGVTANDTRGCFIDWDGSSSNVSVTTCDNTGCKLYKSSSDANVLFQGSSYGDTQTDYYRYLLFTKYGNSGYMLESVSYTMNDDIRVESRLKKMIFNLTTATTTSI